MGKVPRGVTKKVIRSHQTAPKNLSTSTDLLAYLSYVLFLKKLASEAKYEADVSRSNVQSAIHVKKASLKALRTIR